MLLDELKDAFIPNSDEAIDKVIIGIVMFVFGILSGFLLSATFA